MLTYIYIRIFFHSNYGYFCCNKTLEQNYKKTPIRSIRLSTLNIYHPFSKETWNHEKIKISNYIGFKIWIVFEQRSSNARYLLLFYRTCGFRRQNSIFEIPKWIIKSFLIWGRGGDFSIPSQCEYSTMVCQLCDILSVFLRCE